MTQIALDFDAFLAQQGSRLTEALKDGQWHTAGCLSSSLGISDRSLRSAAERSGGAIISGQQGYKLTGMATQEEVSRAELWLRSQAVKMLGRASEIREFRTREAQPQLQQSQPLGG